MVSSSSQTADDLRIDAAKAGSTNGSAETRGTTGRRNPGQVPHPTTKLPVAKAREPPGAPSPPGRWPDARAPSRARVQARARADRRAHRNWCGSCCRRLASPPPGRAARLRRVCGRGGGGREDPLCHGPTRRGARSHPRTTASLRIWRRGRRLAELTAQKPERDRVDCAACPEKPRQAPETRSSPPCGRAPGRRCCGPARFSHALRGLRPQPKRASGFRLQASA